MMLVGSEIDQSLALFYSANFAFTCAGGMGIGMTVSQTLGHHCFLTDPHEASKEVWERSGYVKLAAPSIPVLHSSLPPLFSVLSGAIWLPMVPS